ncbi:MAG: hypothetical protein JWM28_1130 [Chitinophagaceae bacterium]|nr:hypothetical protein [Chitinophagaceae bacterium]
MNNLENIPYEEVVDNNGIPYTEFRKKLTPDYKVTWFHILCGFLIIILILFAGDYLIQKYPGWRWPSLLIFSVLAGFWIAYLNLFVHEAGHFYLHPDKRINDILANILLCSWVGIDIKVYRKMHWQHHRHLGSSSDMETSYFHPLTTGFLFETLSGIHLFRLIITKGNKKNLRKGLAVRAIIMLLAGLTINSLLFFLCIYFHHWWMAIIWVLAMIIFFPFFATIRQVLEHRDELAQNNHFFYTVPQAKISRIFSGSVFSRIFGSAGFNKHMIHHWDPYLPFMSLRKVETFLLNCKRTEFIIKSSQTTYFSAFKKIFTR